MTEPQSSWDGEAWDAEGITVSATPDVDDYVIDGSKLFVYDAYVADYLLCITRTGDGEASEDGITLFLVDAKSSGISYTLLRTTAADKQSEVVFNRVIVPKKNMVGGLDRGWSAMAKALQYGTVLLCAEMVGAGQRALELTVDYAKSRIQFDLPIGINQYVQEHCCNLVADVDSSRWVTYQAAWMLSKNLPCHMEISTAKAWTNEAMEDAFWRAHQVFAGVSFTTQDGVMPLYSKRGKAAQLYLGDTAYHLEKVAHQVERWPAPEAPRGKPLSIFDTPEDEQIPAWDVWRDQTKGKLW